MAQKTEGDGLIYVVTIGLADVGVFNNFPDAFKKFWTDALKQLEKGTTWQVLETMNWITRISNTQLPILIYDARDLAFDIGLITPSGQPKTPPIINEAPTVEGWEEMVRERFVSLTRSGAMACFDQADKSLEELLSATMENGSSEEMIAEIRNMIQELAKSADQSSSKMEEILAKA